MEIFMARPIDSFGSEPTEEVTIEAPVVETEVLEDLAPSVEMSEPLFDSTVVEEPAPVVEAPAPVVEAPAPVVEAPAPVVEAPAPVFVSGNSRVIYSTRERNLPNFGLIKKGYSKVESSKAEILCKEYSFIRYASDSEIKDYAPDLA
jgi:hypothetical protein